MGKNKTSKGVMSVSNEDKIKNKAEELKGQVKEHVGGATGNESKQAEGKWDQTKANVKQAGENVKDAAEDIKDAIKS